jgi:hypothetical protein
MASLEPQAHPVSHIHGQRTIQLKYSLRNESELREHACMGSYKCPWPTSTSDRSKPDCFYRHRSAYHLSECRERDLADFIKFVNLYLLGDGPMHSHIIHSDPILHGIWLYFEKPKRSQGTFYCKLGSWLQVPSHLFGCSLREQRIQRKPHQLRYDQHGVHSLLLRPSTDNDTPDFSSDRLNHDTWWQRNDHHVDFEHQHLALLRVY